MIVAILMSFNLTNLTFVSSSHISRMVLSFKLSFSALGVISVILRNKFMWQGVVSVMLTEFSSVLSLILVSERFSITFAKEFYFLSREDDYYFEADISNGVFGSLRLRILSW